MSFFWDMNIWVGTHCKGKTENKKAELHKTKRPSAEDRVRQ